jgi:hypothetical protein
MRPSDATLDRCDAALAVVIFAVTVVTLAGWWPRPIYGFDEGFFLYQSKRAADGAVMYRDFFDMITPLAYYTMGALYAVFGASHATTRVAMSVLHAVIAVLTYFAARRVNVRRGLAACAAGAHLAICHPALPFGSAHWFSTAFTLALVLYLLGAPVRGGRLAVAGVLVGLLTLTQQQKGVALAAAAAVVVVHDQLAADRRLRATLAALGVFLAALLLTVVPVLLVFVTLAGGGAVFEALVRVPLVNYRDYHRVRWFWFRPELIAMLPQLLSIPAFVLVNTLPLFVPIASLRVFLAWWRGGGAGVDRRLFVACVLGAGALASVAYLPDYSHFAVVGPVLLLLVAESTERVVGAVERRRLPFAGAAATALFALAVMFGFTAALRRERALFPIPHDTPFGRVDFRGAAEVEELESLGAKLRAASATEIFVYPAGAALYLLTETANPTRYQLLMPGYNDAEQFAEVQATLEQRGVPFIVRTFWFWSGLTDPLLPYLEAHYTRVPLARPSGSFPTLTLYRRKGAGAGHTDTRHRRRH